MEQQRARPYRRPRLTPARPAPAAAPPLTDLLKDNFDVTGDNSLKVVNKTANGVTFTTEGTVGKKWSSSMKG